MYSISKNQKTGKIKQIERKCKMKDSQQFFNEICNNYGESNRMYFENCLDLKKTHVAV